MCFACTELLSRNVDTNKTYGTKTANNTEKYEKIYAKDNQKRQDEYNLFKNLDESF